jgi:TonB-dependent SusC/RagA subfamily outer membrane receptor
MAAGSVVALLLGNIVASNAQERESTDSTFLQRTNITDAGAALQGRFSGLLVMNPSGAPGETAKLRVRGFTSDKGNGGPLLIVDGLKVENIQHIDPSMIESVEVLKDGAATALYGIQGGNGVILITTKKGTGKFSVSYDFKMTSSSLGRRADLMNAEEWLQHKKDLNFTNIDFSKYTGIDTDWQDVVYGNGFAHQHGINLQGGNDKGGFFAAVNYLDNNGIVKGTADTHRRTAGQLNGNYRFTDWIEVGLNASFATQDISYINQQSEWFNMFSEIMLAPPVIKPYTSDPNEIEGDWHEAYLSNKNVLKDPSNGLYYTSDMNWVNPLAYRYGDRKKAVQNDIDGILFARLTPFKGFAFTTRFGYRLEQQDRESEYSPYYACRTLYSDYYVRTIDEKTNQGYQADALAEYNLVKGRHDLKVKAGAYYESVVQTFRDGGAHTDSGPLKYEDLEFEETEFESSDLALFGQAGYSFAGRYHVQGSFRADKYDSNRWLRDEKPWNLYPAASVGWTISNEPFFKGVNPSVISNLEMNASWGRGGSTSDLEAFWNPSPVYVIETSEQINVGLDASMFEGRLALAADWYKKTTYNIPSVEFSFWPLYSPKIPGKEDFRSVKNTGLDLELMWKDKVGDFGYSIAGNFSTLKNEALTLPGNLLRYVGVDTPFCVKSSYTPGYPMWHFYGYPEDTTDWYTEKINLGQGIPTSYFGISVNLTYKGFDFNMYGNGTAGNSIANCCIYASGMGTSNLIRDYATEEWVQKVQEWWQNGVYYTESGASVFDGSYFRIRQLQLGYTIPERLTEKIFIRNARVFVSLDDWFTFSSYPGGDPETATTGSRLASPGWTTADSISMEGTDLALGMDYGSYPMSKKMVFGLSVRF